jgi:dihydroxyacid dehydratase/phosphogluconate dehydratase
VTATGGPGLRSDAWLRGDDEVALNHRAALRQAGTGRPLIGIACTASDLNRCDRGLTELAEATRAGVLAAGGLPLAFPVMSLSEDLMAPTAMLYRNLLAIEVEETIRSQPLDGIVALGNCDKTVPAYLMALASADIPALLVTGGFRAPVTFRGERLGSGTSLWRYDDARRSGRLGDADWARLETCLGQGLGACNTMGTASTMAIMAETLGMMLPGTAVAGTGDPRLRAGAEAAGRRIVAMAAAGTRPSAMLTEAGFGNAIAALAAIGGSTNAIIHLCAVAGRRAIRLPLQRFADASAAVPVIADISPVGAGLMPDLAEAGGVPALLAEIAAHLDLTVPTAAGQPLGELLAGAGRQGGAIRPASDPVTRAPAFAVVRGNLAPDGAVIKTAAASPALLRHRGRALVFHSYLQMRARIDDPALDVTPDSVLVLAGCGPIGAGMPEWAMIPIPRKLLDRGVSDMLRISDARMSGTSFGTVVLHVAPESAAGGPLARLRDGDVIRLDAAAGELTAEVDPAVLAAREPVLPPVTDLRGWPLLHRQHVTQAPEGCDYDFLQARTPGQVRFAEPIIGRS